MTTPICPRTIGPMRTSRLRSPVDGGVDWDVDIPEPRPCLGSRCAACVEVARPADVSMADFSRHRLVRCGLIPGGWHGFPDPAEETQPKTQEAP